MDWLTPLQMAGAYLIATTRLLALMVYYITIPLHYPMYYAYALVAFLLSPFRYVFHTFLGLGSFIVDLIARLKYLYLYFACAAFIGICAGCVLHGTSSFMFVLLGVDQPKEPRQQRVSRLPPLAEADDEDEADEGEFGERDRRHSSSPRSNSSGRQPFMPGALARSGRGPDSRRRGEELLRSLGKARRQRRNLLAQTIDEETSDSDFS
ncbi:hypothetical protein F4810DRAFT_693707 [Camillea tinctor]|nr:hypothetical protein F4810DRAFT_693707 [Camillea tinctor]